MIERIFRSSRFLVVLAVIATAVAAILLYGASLSILVNLLMELFQALPTSIDEGKRLAVKLLKLLDLLLIAVTFQLLAVSLFRLFVTPLKIAESDFMSALDIKDFHDLKYTLIQLSVVIMVILFLEQAVEVGATLETLYYGGAIALVIVAAKLFAHAGVAGRK